jgi:hypothetical protein
MRHHNVTGGPSYFKADFLYPNHLPRKPMQRPMSIVCITFVWQVYYMCIGYSFCTTCSYTYWCDIVAKRSIDKTVFLATAIGLFGTSKKSTNQAIFNPPLCTVNASHNNTSILPIQQGHCLSIYNQHHLKINTYDCINAAFPYIRRDF